MEDLTRTADTVPSAPRGWPKLTGNERVALLTLSSPSDPEKAHRGIAKLRSYGFDIWQPFDVTAACRKPGGLFSCATAADRANALEQAFDDPAIRAIFISRGGYGLMEVLPLLEWERIRRTPKPVIGFSDLTALLVPLADRGDMMAVHGAMVASAFSLTENDPEHDRSVVKLMELLFGAGAGYELCSGLTPLLRPQTVEGLLIGGNLTMLASLTGTAWLPDFKGRILFLEDVGERLYRMHRSLMQLKLAGRLDGLAGVVCGDLTPVEDADSAAIGLEDILRDVFDDPRFTYPVFSNAPIGHRARNYPLPIGGAAKLDESGSLVLAGAVALG